MYEHYIQGQEPERYPNNSEADFNYPYTSNNPERIDIEEALNLTLEDYGFTADAIKAYMFGMSVEDPKTGEPMPDEFYIHALEGAISQAEQKLDIAIFPRIEDEYHDYRSQEFSSFMHTHVYRRPIIQLEQLSIEMNGRVMASLPPRGWKVYHLFGHIAMSPSMLGSSEGFNPTMAYLNPPLLNATSMYGQTSAPQMIRVRYLAGMLPRQNATYNKEWEAPATLEKYILKIATREIIVMWGKLLVQPGSAGGTLTMDGISETRRTTASAMYSTVSAELGHIDEEIEALEDGLRSYFGTNSMISV